jgi:uncharacterized protein YdhG (YjbR/CyaY superfamily)
VETVEEYLGAAPEPQRTTLLALRATLRELLPDADETLSYGMPAFLVGGKPVAGYAWAKHHCSYYPHSGAVLSDLADELDGYDWSKGTLRFPIRPAPAPPADRTAGRGQAGASALIGLNDRAHRALNTRSGNTRKTSLARGAGSTRLPRPARNGGRARVREPFRGFARTVGI